MSTMNDGPAYELPAEPWTPAAPEAELRAARARETERWKQRMPREATALRSEEGTEPRLDGTNWTAI
jgi:hypothetical protein